MACQDKLDCDVDLAKVKTNDSIISALEVNQHFTEYWDRLAEPQLKSSTTECYRLTIYDLMERTSSVYTLEELTDSYTLTVRKYHASTHQGRKDSIMAETKKTVRASQWNNFKLQLSNLNYWTLGVRDDRHVLDGTSWILEGFMPDAYNCTEHEYHIVGRASPEPSKFRNVCEELVAIANPR